MIIKKKPIIFISFLLISTSAVLCQDTYLQRQLSNFKTNLASTINSNNINADIEDVSVTVGTSLLNNVKYQALISTSSISTILPTPANNKDTIKTVRDQMKKFKVSNRSFKGAFFTIIKDSNDSFINHWALEYN